jgi:hypothetical protein
MSSYPIITSGNEEEMIISTRIVKAWFHKILKVTLK